MRHGLLQPSFIPPAPVRELPELTRCQKTIVQARTDEMNRLQRVLERCLSPFAEAVELLQTIPGVGEVVATTLVAEIATE